MSPGACPSESETMTLMRNKWQFTRPEKTIVFLQPNPIKRQKNPKTSLQQTVDSSNHPSVSKQIPPKLQFSQLLPLSFSRPVKMFPLVSQSTSSAGRSLNSLWDLSELDVIQLPYLFTVTPTSPTQKKIHGIFNLK